MTGEQPTPMEKPASRLKGAVKVLLKAIALLLVLGVGTGSVLLDVHKIAWYAVFPYTYYMEIKTDLTVDGEPVEITGVARCDWVQQLTPIFPHIRGSSWDRRGGILTKRLPSGEAVIAFVDPPCGARRDPPGFGGAQKGFWKTVHPLDASVGYLPIQTLLLDDTGEPTRIERSYSKAYFEDPRARVHYSGGTWQPMKRAVRPDPREEVPWLRVESGSSKVWAGFFARVTPREVWSKEVAVVAVLEPLTEVTRLTGERQLPSHQDFYLTDGTVRTLFLKDGYWNYRPNGPEPDGMVMLYPRKFPVWKGNAPPDHDDSIFHKQAQLSVNGRPTGVDPPMYRRPVYEPESGTLLIILSGGFIVSADEVRFGRGSNTLSGVLFKF